MAPEQSARLGLRGRAWESADGSGTLTGTFLISAVEVAPSRAWDYEPFRRVEPVDRRGNLLVYRGTFRLPWLKAQGLYFEGLSLAHGPWRNAAKARDRFAEAARLHPGAFAAALELGNLEMELGRPKEAVAAWEAALAAVPEDDETVRAALRDRIDRLRRSPGDPPRPIRNPWLE
jgi:tetratricopeptide (TPR) repeat protein